MGLPEAAECWTEAKEVFRRVVSASSLHAGQSGEEIIPVRCWK